MRIHELTEDISQNDLNRIKVYADRLFSKVGIDVEFTRHFIQRANDARNIKPISAAELTRLFKQEFKRNGKPIAQMGPDAEAVMRDMSTDVNMPFVLVWDKQNQELDLIAKTIMRKKDFKTADRVYTVEYEITTPGIDEDIINVNDMDHAIKRATAVAAMCKKLGDRPLLYRQFESVTLVRDLIVKVTNQGELGKIKKGRNSKQAEILKLLGVSNPIFALMSPPAGTAGGFGQTNILLPATDDLYWSPAIVDLGSMQRAGEEKPDRTIGLSFKAAAQFQDDINPEKIAGTYQRGWPAQPTTHEIIVDTEYYYLVNLNLFLGTYTGKPNKEMIGTSPGTWFRNIKQELYNKKFKTYNNIAWFLETPVIRYMEFLKNSGKR